ncbi:MAG: hypothetical protein IJ089_02280 [Clostridia bacterium]|nr:hypothetical protein [Clostridia bacterium]
MYNVSEQYKTAIRSHSRKFDWYGTITTTAGKVYHFTTKDIVKGSGSITRSCSGSTSLELGSVYAAELDISLFLDVDRYSMYDAEIDLYFAYKHRTMRLWNDLRERTWDSISDLPWNGGYTPEAIPMGKFVISEATRTLTVLQIKAYDYMLRFEKNMRNSGSVKSAYDWLLYACKACKVELGISREAVAAMPNGSMMLSFTATDDVKTYRDLISHVATVLCGVCQIDRSGALTVIPFSNTPVMDIPASWRYSSKIADYITRYSGLYATYRAGGLTEYYKVEPDDGLIYNIGTNPFMQIASTTERAQALQRIINHLSATTYTPFEAEIPGDPSLDPMDVLSLSGGQALGEIACITEIVIRINGKSTIKCVGENPRLNQAKSRYTKDIEGLLAQSEGMDGTSTFWMSDAYSPSDLAVAETETVVTSTQFEIQSDKSRGEIIWTGTYTLDQSSVITANVYLDDRLIYSCKDFRMTGNAVLTVSTPFEILRGDEGVHEVKIALVCQPAEETELSYMLRQLASLENRVRQIEKGFNNEIAVDDAIHADLALAIGVMDEQTGTAYGTSDSREIDEPIRVELMAMISSLTEEAGGESE